MPLNRKGFARLLERYQQGKTTPEEKRFMDLWYDATSKDYTSHEEHENEKEGKEMWTVIQQGISRSSESKSPLRIRWHPNIYIRVAAASVVFLMGFFAYNLISKDEPVIAGVDNGVIEKMTRTANDGEKSMLVKLSDGSRVTLDPGAALYYPASFSNEERNVFLKGNGFFDIAPDKSRPFLVHAGNIVTRVVGTSFTIRENQQSKSIEVAVMTGVVEVAQAGTETPVTKHTNKVTLTPNKKVTFYTEGERLVTGLVEQPRLIAKIKNDPDFETFIFREKAMSQILPQLERAYGVRISLSNQMIRNCLVTADVSQDKTLFAQLDILCAAINADYKVENDMVFVQGTGCEDTNKSDNP